VSRARRANYYLIHDHERAVGSADYLRHQADRAAGCGLKGDAKDGGRPQQSQHEQEAKSCNSLSWFGLLHVVRMTPGLAFLLRQV
jgi:hypothetical protein